MDDSAHERVYDAVPFDELEYDEDEELYTYQCPGGDLFEISQAELDAGERILTDKTALEIKAGALAAVKAEAADAHAGETAGGASEGAITPEAPAACATSSRCPLGGGGARYIVLSVARPEI